MIFILLTFSFSFIIKESYGAKWLKIFYHNSTGGKYFKNISHTLNSNSLQLYSILDKLNQNFSIDGYYEFLLEYPGYVGYNRWKQLLLPFNDFETTTSAKGYTEISCSWKEQYWGGLVRSSRSTQILLDGSAGHINWFYSIGVISPAEYYPKFPGPSINNQVITVYEVYLWIRILNTFPFEKNYSFNSLFKFFRISFLIFYKFFLIY